VVSRQETFFVIPVAAVIPNWNGANLLRALLPTMAAQTFPFESVLVVDNGSADESAVIAAQFGAAVHRLPVNAGFAAAVNRGVDQVSAEIVAIVNNDVELRPDWLHCAMEAFGDPGVSFVTGKTVCAAKPAVVDGTFDAVCRGGTALRCGSGEPDGPLWLTPRRIQFAPMTAMLIRRSVFLEVGGLDELFESYLEDVDFGLRCASLGYTGVYEPRAVARHRGSATLGVWSARTVRNIARNQVLLLARHYDSGTLRRFGWQIAVAQALWGMVAARHGRPVAWLTGKIEGLRQFRMARRTGNPRVAEVLEASEREIYEMQRQLGPDLYWRLYFALGGVPGT
jgi:GT2 family glycosyltransferase